MRYLPIHIDMKDARILVIGGANAAEAKLRTLVKTEADIVVIAPQISPEIERWKEEGALQWEAHGLAEADFKGVQLVYAATDDHEENAIIANLARSKDVLVNAADQKTASDFITPALVDRSPVTISIGTEGASPSLARALKSDLEMRLPSTLGSLAETVSDLRAKVANRLTNLAARQLFWAKIFGGKDLDNQLKLTPSEIVSRVEDSLKNAKSPAKGTVALVGAGPGDPDLLTLAAIQKLHSADVIVYDRLVSQGVLDYGRREAEHIYVGKEPGGKSTPQEQINAILVEKASQGLTVVRLKSGDPLIFGRADEEIDSLETAEIPYSIVPGITSAASAAAEIGASLTTRGRNKSISFLTGHDAKGFAEHDWKSLAESNARAAIYMGVGASRFIQGRLLLHGAKPSTSVTVVENASKSEQRIVSSRLQNLPQDIEMQGIKGPAILLLGYNPRGIATETRRLKAAQ